MFIVNAFLGFAGAGIHTLIASHAFISLIMQILAQAEGLRIMAPAAFQLQPLKNTVVLIPGPSFSANRSISVIKAVSDILALLHSGYKTLSVFLCLYVIIIQKSFYFFFTIHYIYFAYLCKIGTAIS